MPNRILKESICASENVDALSTEAEVFFYRLLVQCDDYGRFDARHAVLRSRCFPLRVDRVTEKVISKWLNELVGAGLVWIYTDNERPYLQVTKWEAHQQIRAKRSKFPEPQADASNGNQLPANVPVIQSNPIQSESNPIRESKEGADAQPAHQTKNGRLLPEPVKVFIENGGKFKPNKRNRAEAYILEHVKDTPDSLALWAKVVDGYTAQWSAYSYTVMISGYYQQGRIPGQANKNPSNGRATTQAEKVAELERFVNG